jgi:UDP-N-acetylglucosamine 2-epimerase (non-hydrolysing)
MNNTLLKNLIRFKEPIFFDENNLKKSNYFVLTLHRPANIYGEQKLKFFLGKIIQMSKGLPIVFHVHLRIVKNFQNLGINAPNLFMIEPMIYLEFNYLVKNTKAVLKDSGGITEETTQLRMPSITLRNYTEHPETVEIGTNELIVTNPVNVLPASARLFLGQWKKGGGPPLWDAKTSVRIVEHLLTIGR